MGNIRWFTAGSTNQSIANVSHTTSCQYDAFTSYNHRTLQLLNCGYFPNVSVEAFAFDNSSSQRINNGTNQCGPPSDQGSAHQWLAMPYWPTIPTEVACTEDGVPVDDSTSFWVQSASLSSKGIFITTPETKVFTHHDIHNHSTDVCYQLIEWSNEDPEVHICEVATYLGTKNCTYEGCVDFMNGLNDLTYYIGNTGAWVYEFSYPAPGSTIGHCALTADASTQSLRARFGTYTASGINRPDVGYFVVGVILWIVGFVIIAGFPWLDKIARLWTNNGGSLFECKDDTFFKPAVWTAVSAVHGAFMIAGFSCVVLGAMEMKSSGTPVYTEGDPPHSTRDHRLVGYWTFLVWLLQIMGGVGLWFVLLFHMITESKMLEGWPTLKTIGKMADTSESRWLLVASHATGGFILTAMILYLTWTGSELASNSTAKNAPNTDGYRQSVLAVACACVLLCVVNLGLWRRCNQSADKGGYTEMKIDMMTSFL